MPLKMKIIYGSVREERQGIKAAKFITNKIRERGHDAELIDPQECEIPLLKKTFEEYKQAPENLKDLSKKFKEADAFVIVTAEYNHSPPPALTNLLDHFMPEYFFKPSAIVSYSAGSFGGVRAAIQLRSLVAELGMSSIPSMLPIPKVQEQFDDSGVPKDPEYWNKRTEKFFKELEWYSSAIKKAREGGTPY